MKAAEADHNDVIASMNSIILTSGPEPGFRVQGLRVSGFSIKDHSKGSIKGHLEGSWNHLLYPK